MAVRYHGIKLTAPTSATPFTADTQLHGFDVIVTASTGPAFITGQNGVQMAVLATGVPFHLGGTDPVSGEPLRLSEYQAQAAAGDVHIAYAVRTP
jgi:hypothetical protein